MTARAGDGEQTVVTKVELVGEVLMLSEDNLKRVSIALVSSWDPPVPLIFILVRMVLAFFGGGRQLLLLLSLSSFQGRRWGVIIVA